MSPWCYSAHIVSLKTSVRSVEAEISELPAQPFGLAVPRRSHVVSSEANVSTVCFTPYDCCVWNTWVPSGIKPKYRGGNVSLVLATVVSKGNLRGLLWLNLYAKELNYACHLNDACLSYWIVGFSSHVSFLCRFIMSSHLQWMVIRNCSSFLLKRNGQTYSTVSNCLPGRTTFEFG